jgi:hypothetical protein
MQQSIRSAAACAVLALVAGLAGCQKASEAVTEKAMEKSIEAQMKKDGATEAKVDLSSGTVKSVSVDKDGKKQEFEVGNASAVTEADIGLPFYPGAKIDSSHVMKVAKDGEVAAMMPLETTDSPDKVVAFYRERLQAMSAGHQFMDMAQGDGNHTLMLVNDAKSEVMQVLVTAGKDGAPSTVLLNTTRKKPA